MNALLPNINFAEYLKQCQQRIESVLDRHLPEATEPALLLKSAMRYSTLGGGKRVRATLAYAAASAVSDGDDTVAAVNTVACALEIMHAYSLIHDDLPAMDNDDLRRGKPTCHKAFDEATAILAGDALQALAFTVITTDHNIPANLRVELVATLARSAGHLGMVAGQSIDLAAVNQHISITDLEVMHRHKTGALIRASVAMGALVTGRATPSMLTSLDNYADAIGLAFQVQDDILDVEAGTDTLGKQAGADQARNKPTYPALLGLDGAHTLLRELHNAAVSALNCFGPSADPLRALAHYIVSRHH